MPVIRVKLIDEVFTAAQKNEIIAKLTEAMASVKGETTQTVTWVVIEDVRSGDLWHVGSRVEYRRNCTPQSQIDDGWFS